MYQVILPASAAAFVPRSSPRVVLGSKIPPWLTTTLKQVNRINNVKSPLNNVAQHTCCLTETLSSPSAVWTLCSMIISKAPEDELCKNENPLIEALFNYQTIHVNAYVVAIDMVSFHQVAFKLTEGTIEDLVDYHEDIFLVDAAANTSNWSGKDADVKSLRDEFVQVANKFIYWANIDVLEGLEAEGTGELLSGQSEDAKSKILSLFVPLLPPQPQMVIVSTPTTVWSHPFDQGLNSYYWEKPITAGGGGASFLDTRELWNASHKQPEWMGSFSSFPYSELPDHLLASEIFYD
ncbi:hypothetical protein N7490_006516 [Penicillium lividum]|nr:hypothetical protein N7490_006516 [Penicillium lividum]